MNMDSWKESRLPLFLLFIVATAVGCVRPQAQWITAEGFEHAPNQWYQLRTQVDLRALPDTLPTTISADSKYWLYVNGELVVFEGQLKRGPNSEDTYYDVVDLAPYLQKGENTIAALVWYFGREGFSHKDSGQFGFYLENRRFVSDSTWRIAQYDAYQGTDGIQGNWRFPESNVRYDARLAIEDWTSPDFDDSQWSFASERGVRGVAPWNELAHRIIPQFKTFPLHKTTDFTQQGDTVQIPLPYNMQYHAYLKVKAPAGRLIAINPDNLATLNDTPLRGEYITREGVQSYLHLPFLSGHAIELVLEPGVELLEVGYMESGYDTELDGVLEIDDPLLNRYIDKAKRTLYVNMRDTYYDCPDRERAQWIGDGVILSEEAFYLADNKAIALTEKMYRELLGWQRADSSLFAPVPTGNWAKELPQQCLSAVGTYGIGRYVLYSGDTAMIEYAYPAIKRYLALWRVGEDGSVPFRKGAWTWGDWGTHIDRELMEHIWVYIALENMAAMADHLGKTAEADSTRGVMESIKARLNTHFWTPQGYLTPNHEEGLDDRGNALAVVAGIADSSKYPVLLELFKEKENASPYMEKYVMEALFQMGEGELAIERFKRRYHDMIVDTTCSTLWEFWDGTCSRNHAWSGGPLSVLYKRVAGIEPTAFGFAEFTIYPELIGTDRIRCSFSTVRGEILVEAIQQKELFELGASVPEGSVATIRIPHTATSATINGEAVGAPASSDKHYRYYRLTSGEHRVSYMQ